MWTQIRSWCRIFCRRTPCSMPCDVLAYKVAGRDGGCNKRYIKTCSNAFLNYPVITSREYAHRGSFKQLLGGNETEELLELLSLEKQVTEHTPPAFIWHTYTDQSVPVQNSLLLIGAMKNMRSRLSSICIR